MVPKAAAAVLAAAFPAASAAAASIDKRIVGGVNVEGKSDFSYVVAVNSASGIFCGGILIGPKTAVTAAHCVEGAKSVRAGSRDSETGGIVVEIEESHIHPDFDEGKPWEGTPVLLHDIAVLKLKFPIRESSSISYARLPANGSYPVAGSKATAAGWGSQVVLRDRDTPQPAVHLAKVELQIHHWNFCRSLNRGASDDGAHRICAGGGTQGKNVCKYDSGGPLQAASGEVIGLMSWVIPDKKSTRCKDKPAVFTSLGFPSFLSFIEKHREKTNSKPSTVWEWSPEMLQERCAYFDELVLSFELSSGPGRNVIKIDFPGAGAEAHTIYTGPDAGSYKWQHLNMNKTFRSAAVEPSLLSRVRLLADPGGWRVVGMKFRGRCDGSNVWLQNDKFASFDKTLRIKPDGTGSLWGGSTYKVWEGSLPLEDWAPKPACTHLQQMQATLRISDAYWSGTDNDLYLVVGEARYLLAHRPSRGEVFTALVDLVESYGSPIVAVEDVKHIAVHSQGQHDQFLPQLLTITGLCHGPANTLLEIKHEANEWVAAGDDLSIDISPDLWEMVKRK
ncbi:Peptidase cysteine/serine, trypsin-like protein [Metarhizium album ARSEF 1941]|uniref:Peptidase cysteine/serine, trypsin-like protein n=1 Tax=Metarhizium album (strain ARSEF 1941) TaxID=1081103 RepID=A0A0B2WZW3_METAS|nr:Peptidase cysteine/serine, trypsin-like protein [Metarhizium album ARSEF 1941]KHN99593.1 Peptidase cysteine/serine, trypsin-like protein [Metarhizium album ARSEF 1941]